jgi:hypothetical protein
MLSFQLLRNAKNLASSTALRFLPEEVQLPGKTIVSQLSSQSDFSNKPIERALEDAMGKTHYLVKYDVRRDPPGHCRTNKRKCKKCLEKTKEWMLASIVSLVEKTSPSATMLAAGIVSTTMCKK